MFLYFYLQYLTQFLEHSKCLINVCLLTVSVCGLYELLQLIKLATQSAAKFLLMNPSQCRVTKEGGLPWTDIQLFARVVLKTYSCWQDPLEITLFRQRLQGPRGASLSHHRVRAESDFRGHQFQPSYFIEEKTRAERDQGRL